jgi:hypothetical protein
MEFTYNGYEKMITALLDMRYEICSYENVTEFGRAVILRHDIDFSPIKAAGMAKMEYQLGVKSTYFVLVSTEFYNVFSSQTAEILCQILKMGHDIGLHFDEQRYETSSIEQTKDYVYQESKILEKALGTTINTISMHRPSKFTLDSNIEFEGLINSYSQMFFKNMKYVSDSRMHWQEEVTDIIKSSKFNKIHILTHPFWYSHKPESTRDKLLHFINGSNKNRYELVNKNFQNLDEYVKRDDIV